MTVQLETTPTSSQLQAIKHPAGPLMILAGAGTGKTSVMVQRVAWLVESGLADPSEILVLSFTEKAAEELSNRLDVILPLGKSLSTVTTFHSYCDSVLRSEALHVGFSPDFKLMSEIESVSFLKKHIYELNSQYFRPIGSPYKFLEGLLQFFSRLKDEEVDPGHFSRWVSTKMNNSASDTDKSELFELKDLSDLYLQYEDLKLKEGVLDFSDLVTKTVFLFEKRPHVLNRYQKKYKYILVDEYQDTNKVQAKLLKLLSENHKNITIVADDDQSIYSWRGASMTNLFDFKKSYPNYTLVVLTDNFRSTQNILDQSYSFIQNNNPARLEVTEQISKKLVSRRGIEGEKVEHLSFSTSQDEAAGVADQIEKLIEEKKIVRNPGDIAILVRANSHAAPFIKELESRGISCQFLGPTKLFDQPEIKDLMAFLRVVDNPHDDLSFYRILTSFAFRIDPLKVSKLSKEARETNSSLFDKAIEIHKENPDISAVVRLVSENIEKKRDVSVGGLVYGFLKDSGQLKRILRFSTAAEQAVSENIAKFFNKIKSFENEAGVLGLRSALDWFELNLQLGDSPMGSELEELPTETVNILTVHSSKGLEFPVVFMVSLVEGRFPSISKSMSIQVPGELISDNQISGDPHLHEERRLFYVGMTRAKDRLFLTSSNFYGTGKRRRKPSRFIGEAGCQAASEIQVGKSEVTVVEKTVAAPGQSIKINYLSHSQIETFETCPLHYWAKYIMKLPVPTSPASLFGNAIHLALKLYYQHQIDHENTPDLVELFKSNWNPRGFISQKQKQEYFDLGIQYLRKYQKQNHKPASNTLMVEEPFSVNISHDLKIGGKIDRIDLLAGGTLEIIDYKTSKTVLSQREADSDLQLSMYAIAAPLLVPKSVRTTQEKIVLSLYYLDTQKKVTTTRSVVQSEEAIQKIIALRNRIEASDFRCNNPHICKKCDFAILCDASQDD